MENKYQIALNDISVDYDGLLNLWKSGLPSYEYEKLKKQVNEDISALQELIDKTTICGLSLDEAIPVIEMYKQLKYTTHQIEPIQDLMMGTKSQYYYDGKHSIGQLEKALDEACYWLNKNRLEAYCPFDLDLKDCDKGLCLSSEKCWKEYLLKEVQDGK